MSGCSCGQSRYGKKQTFFGPGPGKTQPAVRSDAPAAGEPRPGTPTARPGVIRPGLDFGDAARFRVLPVKTVADVVEVY